MAYNQLGLIQAYDYNNLVGTAIPSVTANQINTVWAIGTGDAGYGQTAMFGVGAGGTVTATNWSTLITTLNNILAHQSGATAIALPTVGQTIAYLNSVYNGVTTAYTNRVTAKTYGTTATGLPYAAGFNAPNTPNAATFTVTRTVTFETAEKARYFFNCGGYINFVTVSAVDAATTSRSADIAQMLQNNMGTISKFAADTSAGKSGTTGATSGLINRTDFGYYQTNTTNTKIYYQTSSVSSYANDYVQMEVKTDALNADGNQDHGKVLTFTLTVYSASRAGTGYGGTSNSGPGSGTNYINEDIYVTYNHRLDVIYPETTQLTNSWGVVTIG
jgi:hypothetical protein